MVVEFPEVISFFTYIIPTLKNIPTSKKHQESLNKMKIQKLSSE